MSRVLVRLTATLIVAFIAAALVPTGASAAPTTKQRLQSVKTFVPALGAKLTATNIKRLAARDLVVVDGDDATADQVQRLRAKGAIVLGYLSVGSVESWRSWFPLLKDYRLGELGDWDGERYTDLSKAEARDALADKIAPQILAKGFDGLFLDNVDMVEDHSAQQPGMVDLVKRLSARVRADGHVLMAQNADVSIDPFVGFLDAWNREDPTGTYDFEKKRYQPTDEAGRRLARATIKKLRAAGLLVTTTDYFGSPTSAQAKRAIRIACKAGAVPFVGEILLAKIPAKAARC